MKLLILGLALLTLMPVKSKSQEMPDYWSKEIGSGKLSKPDTKWFEEAKFGLFIHWGLYSAAGNTWKGKNYYGSGEWLMNRGKIPVSEYEALARDFNPVNFDAKEWASFAKEAGARYMVITSKHHEGFAMFGSKASPYNIVDATPYKKDPMKDLAEACRDQGVKFGFYYSQFLDWHEPNGGGNTWDFKGQKDYKKYYAEKSIPQIKELLSNYGPLGIMWFDMPGGLTRDETLAFMAEVRKLQPTCLISSRVGNGLGDFRDFGDSELPPGVIEGPWEALFTHNDSWGYVRSDLNFKTPREIMHLLASTAARGGNLILNVGPDGTGRIPEMSLRYLREVGHWLADNGESIYGTTRSPLPDQPWGVSTLKGNKLFLHLFDRPTDNVVFVPGVTAQVNKVALLNRKTKVKWDQKGSDVAITLPANLSGSLDTVIVVDLAGAVADSWKGSPTVISRQYESFNFDAARGTVEGKTTLKSLTHSRYFGNWKHDLCVLAMQSPADRISFGVRFTEPGDYRLTLEYACNSGSKGREGVVEIGQQIVGFETLLTGEHDTHQPLMFVRHSIGIVHIDRAGDTSLAIHPLNEGPELFQLRRVVVEPVKPKKCN